MAVLEIDTGRIRGEGENLKTIARDYNRLLNELYQKINSIGMNQIWTSEKEVGAANTYIRKVLEDKPNMMALGNSMNELGQKMISYANNMDSTADSRL